MKPDYTGSMTAREIPPHSLELAMSALASDVDTREYVPPPPDHVCRWHSGYRELADMGYRDFMEEILHLFECDKPDCPLIRTRAFTESCLAQAEKIHFPLTRRLMVKKRESRYTKEIKALWLRFTAALKITDKGLLDKWREADQCMSPWCPSRGDRSGPAKKTCSGCEGVRYCSRLCQKAYVSVSFLP